MISECDILRAHFLYCLFNSSMNTLYTCLFCKNYAFEGELIVNGNFQIII